MSLLGNNPEKVIIQEIKNFIAENPGNRDSRLNGDPYFEDSLVGFADARDPLFETYKDIIGDFHLTPIEVLDRFFPEHEGWWEGASVISWILPIAGSVRESNRRETRGSSEAWLITKTFGEEFNIKLAEHVAAFLTEQGFYALVPTLSPFFEIVQTERAGFAANWSERHVAYAAGLGTFSLSGALITERGAAMRCGSLVTSLKLQPTKRQYGNFREYCLFYNSDSCGKCISRCPGGAISEEGHNKELCMIHCASVVQEIEGKTGGMPGCGLCQTAVPCEAEIPGKKE
jgi:epoxyqueuosine reductase QueG